ncbi:MAG: P-loop NTPase fold protein [Alphaproteobacteria bacterium]
MPGPDAYSSLLAALRQCHAGQRSMIAVAGPPGVGKSTFAEKLKTELNDSRPDCCEILAMDGFHYDDRVLNARGWRARKGAPHTFDVAGLHALIARLRTNAETEIAVPVFDRSIEIARAAAAIIPQSVDLVLVEGNYLLLTTPPWPILHPLFDVTVMLQAPEPVLRQRLTERWQGQDLSPDQISQKVEANDLANATTVIEQSRAADFAVPSSG